MINDANISKPINKNRPWQIFGLMIFIGLFFIALLSISNNNVPASQEQSLAPALNFEAPQIEKAPEAKLPTNRLPSSTTRTTPTSLLFFGDMMLDRSVKKQIDAIGANELFKPLLENDEMFFKRHDIVHANLEGPIGDKRRPTSKSIAFNFDPKLIPFLQEYGFTTFNLANNHTLDMGKEAFEETKKNLTNGKIEFYGEQYTADEDALLIKKINEVKIAFIGVNDTNSPLSWIEVEKLIKQAEQDGDITIVNIHCGAEYKLASNDRQQKLAHKMIDSGVDIIIGHHPHVVQEIEIYKDRPIFYSLGNFIFDQYFSTETQQGISIAITLNDPTRMLIRLYPLRSQKSIVSFMKNSEAIKLIQRITEKNKIQFDELVQFEIPIKQPT